MTAQDTYNLYLYERNVQVVGLRSIDAPILIDTIRTGRDTPYITFFLHTRVVAALPEGVTLSVHEHTRDMEEERLGQLLLRNDFISLVKLLTVLFFSCQVD